MLDIDWLFACNVKYSNVAYDIGTQKCSVLLSEMQANELPVAEEATPAADVLGQLRWTIRVSTYPLPLVVIRPLKNDRRKAR